MKGKSNFGTIIVSGLISMIFIAGASYFALPLIYPNINEENETETETPNILLQSKHIDITTQAEIWDSEVDFVKINDTELSITTQGNSSLAVLFTMPIMVDVDFMFTGTLYFEFVIAIEGIGNRTIPLSHHKDETGSDIFSGMITINYLTGIIPSDTYDIAAFWRSRTHVSGNIVVQSYTISYGGHNFTRTIWAQELRG